MCLPANVSSETHARIVARIVEAQKKLQTVFPQYAGAFPSIVYDLNGTTGGYAAYSENLMRLHPVFLNNHSDHYIDKTVGHEFAHLAAYHLFGYNGTGHGSRWKMVMRAIGLTPTRCHDYDVSDPLIRTKRTHEWKCYRCGVNGYCTKKFYESNATSNLGWHRCAPGVRGKLEFTGKLHPAAAARATTLLPQSASSIRPGTKLYEMVQIIKTNPTIKKNDAIWLAQRDLGMSLAGATTYWYKVKSLTF